MRRSKWTGTLGCIGVVFLAACESSEPLETRTFRLEGMSGYEASALIDPYVYEREGQSGALSATRTALTVRERPENLDRIAEVLAELDTAYRTVRLSFSLIRANGAGQLSEDLADVEAELREVLRFEGYTLVARALVQTDVDTSGSVQTLTTPDGEEYQIEVSLSSLIRAGESTKITATVKLSDPHIDIFGSTVTMTEGRTLVLGTAADRSGDGEALILVVRPDFDVR